jgi:GNAT superfamily N-acetyltransferase
LAVAACPAILAFMSWPGLPPQRPADVADAAQIQDLMRQSARDLFPSFYDERQVASGVIHIAHLDMRLIEDGTYFIHEADGEIVACGGWSRRAKLYTGSGAADDDERLLDPATEPARVRAMFVRGDWARRGIGRAILEACERAARSEGFQKLVLMATLPGEPFYRAFGFREIERVDVPLPDGVTVGGVVMERAITADAG